METPKNCLECQHKESCHAPHYGGSLCRYEEAICSKTVKEILAGPPKD